MDASNHHTLLDILIRGGWLMLPLLLCSLVSLAIVVERSLWGPRRRNVLPENLLEEIKNLLSRGKVDEARGLCKANNSPLSGIALAVINNIDKPRTEIVEAAELVGRKEAIKLQRNIGILGIISGISPLLGLLGTVVGMISTFDVIQAQGVGNADALAGGISEALITTATGLTIAIPSFVFYRYFLHRAKNLAVELEEAAAKILNSATRPSTPVTAIDSARSSLNQ